MSDGVKDMVALLQVIADKRVTDEKFAAVFEKVVELLNESSTALAEVAEGITKPADKGPLIDPEALGKAIAAALVVGLKNLAPPKLEMPAAAPAAPSWTALNVKTPKGETYTITRK